MVTFIVEISNSIIVSINYKQLVLMGNFSKFKIVFLVSNSRFEVN